MRKRFKKLRTLRSRKGLQPYEGERSHDFHGRNLTCSDFHSSDLRRANFLGANLAGANFNHADLRGANFDLANLQYSSVILANLHQASFYYAWLDGAVLVSARLLASNLQYSKLRGAELANAKFQAAALGHSELQGATLSGVDFRGAALDYAQLQGADLQDADLRGADLYEARLQGAILNESRLRLANFSDAIVWGASGAKCNDANVGLFTPITANAPIVLPGIEEREKEHMEWVAPNREMVDRFIQDVVRSVSTLVQQSVRKKLVSRLEDKDDTAAIDQSWRACAAKKPSQYEGKLVEYLTDLACSPGADQQYVLYGVYQNYIIGHRYRLDEVRRRLSKIFLGNGNKPCPGIAFAESIREKLNQSASAHGDDEVN
jgi:uncharacterized protein YjbI with pentapeptide repeats